MQIEDGTGTGRRAGVNLVNQLMAAAVVVPQIGHVSCLGGTAYALPFTQAGNAGADDCILYIKNNDEMALIISKVYLSCTAADELIGKLNVVGTAAGGTAPVPVNLNTASAALANVTTRQHTSITGLSGGNIFIRATFTALGASVVFTHDESVVLSKNGAWSLHIKSAQANTVSGTVVFFMHEEV